MKQKPQVQCLKCSHLWTARSPNPPSCPRCGHKNYRVVQDFTALREALAGNPKLFEDMGERLRDKKIRGKVMSERMKSKEKGGRHAQIQN